MADDQDDFAWMQPYVAGAFDWAGSLSAYATADDAYRFGYRLVFQIRFEKGHQTAVGLIDEFCEMVGITPNLSVTDREGQPDQYRLQIGRREDIRDFLEAVFPYLVARHEQARILLEEVFPALEEKEHHEQEGLIRIVKAIDRVQEEGFQRGSHKKTTAEEIASEVRDQ